MSASVGVTVTVLATMRLTRFVTTDSLPETLVITRVRRRASRARWRRQQQEGGSDTTVWEQAEELVDCPFCISQWIALAVLLLPDTKFFRTILRSLALSYVVGHVVSRLDATDG